jgi:hypothetical protein
VEQLDSRTVIHRALLDLQAAHLTLSQTIAPSQDKRVDTASTENAAKAYSERRMTANSGKLLFKVSTVFACRAETSLQGLMQKATAVSGESGRPVVDIPVPLPEDCNRAVWPPRSSGALGRQLSYGRKQAALLCEHR